MKPFHSLTARLLFIVLFSGVFPLAIASFVSMTFLVPYFTNAERESAVTETNRILDIIERDLNSSTVTARGIASYILRGKSGEAQEDPDNAMDIFALDFLSVSANGMFAGVPGWIRTDTEIEKIPDTSVFMNSVLNGRYAPERISTLGFMSVGKISEIYVMTASSTAMNEPRIIIGYKLSSILENHLSDYPDIAIQASSAPENMNRYAVPISLQEDSIVINPVSQGNILIRNTPKSIITSLVIPVPYLENGLLLEIEQNAAVSNSLFNKLARILLIITLLLLMQMILLGIWAYSRVSRPLNELIKAITSWNEEKVPDFTRIKGKSDEIGKLVSSFEELFEEILLKNRLLKTQAIEDALTGLYNRRYFDETLIQEWNRHKRRRLPMAVIMADIDYFKIYNDTYGHVKGDECLQQVAAVCRESLLRPGDLCFRYGGEEFAFILPETNFAGALSVAQRVREAVAALKIPHKNRPDGGYVSISLGLAVAGSRENGEVESPENIVRRADKALYKAKEEGRDRVVSI